MTAEKERLWLNVLGEMTRIVLPGKSTGNGLALFEVISKHGGGTPPHTHTLEDESFYVLEGKYLITAGGVENVLEVGESVCGMRGIKHNFTCISPEGGRLLVLVQPAGLEHFFEEIDALTPEEMAGMERVMGICEKYGIALES